MEGAGIHILAVGIEGVFEEEYLGIMNQSAEDVQQGGRWSDRAKLGENEEILLHWCRASDSFPRAYKT
jgi:hypothetical protein